MGGRLSSERVRIVLGDETESNGQNALAIIGIAAETGIGHAVRKVDVAVLLQKLLVLGREKKVEEAFHVGV